MPSITTASEPVTEFPNKYVSPYGNDGIIPLYSSIPILEYQGTTSCLPCVVCGKSSVRQEINSSQSLNSQNKQSLQVTTTTI
jgi:hypothetical protein